MKIAKDRRPDLKKTSPKENLNLSSVACDPCSNEALKIERQIKSRPVSEIKINEIIGILIFILGILILLLLK